MAHTPIPGATYDVSDINTGGPAFPVIPPFDTDGWAAPGYPHADPGMTLRDYFAAKAMQGMLAEGCTDIELIARDAYVFADAMIKARNQ